MKRRRGGTGTTTRGGTPASPSRPAPVTRPRRRHGARGATGERIEQRPPNQPPSGPGDDVVRQVGKSRRRDGSALPALRPPTR
jgi:hypothetical protein